MQYMGLGNQKKSVIPQKLLHARFKILKHFFSILGAA